MSARFALFATVAMCAWTCALGTLALATPAHARSASASALSCGAEDGPTWNWARCGNHKRGVVTLYGNVRTVGPCQFARLWRAGHLRYSVRVQGRTYRHLLPRLRGDGFARKHGCAATRNPA